MADESPQQPDGEAGSLSGLLPGLQGAEASALQIRIKNSICKSAQCKVDDILQDVEKFSDIEKLYLYLKLPSGFNSSAEKSDQNSMSSSRTQQVHAFSWIRDHLEEYPETSLPKQEVYDEYKSFCDNLNHHPLSAADFGKMMKNVFPNMKPRRLGMRGKSKYCYSGLRKKTYVHMPSLPTLDLHKTADGHQGDVLELPGQLSNIRDEVRFAACDLVCEWAQKVLKQQFDAVEDLARFLVDSHNISNKSLAALTVMTGTATEVKPLPPVSAFAPTAQAHSFRPHVTTLSSLSVDAKQQLQKKIQRKQQEQKMHSPSPGDRQPKRADDTVSCVSPALQSSRPAIGIVVASVPSPITVQRTCQLTSPSPITTVESKVLPVNFQVVPQPFQAVKQSPKPLQNTLSSSGGERAARQRYAQILPKPSAGVATISSPSSMIVNNSPVMTTCHISPVSLVSTPSTSKMSSLSETSRLTTNSSLDITSMGNGIKTPGEPSYNTLTPAINPGQSTSIQNMDVELEVEAIHKNSQMQHLNNQVSTRQVSVNRPGGASQRAASVPIPQTKHLLEQEEAAECCKKSSSTTSTLMDTSTNCISSTSLLNFTNQETTKLSTLTTNRFSPYRESGQGKEGFMFARNVRKRCGRISDLSPVKRVFMPRRAADGASGPRDFSARGSCRLTSPARPESAPASREVEMITNSILPSHSQCPSSLGTFNFESAAKTRVHTTEKKNTPNDVEAVCQRALQEHQGHSMANMHALPCNPLLQTLTSESSNSNTCNIDGALQQTHVSSSPGLHTTQFLNQPSCALLPPDHIDYFSFDDDVTQDSIVEELVQMEEHMKLKHLEGLNCGTLQGQHPLMSGGVTSTNQAMAAVGYTANRSSNPIQTPTPTSEMLGGPHNLTGESPFSRIASTTPVDSALGSSRHTPAGTPHSSCSSTVPPSPIECRNPFAFTPINSTGFHDSSPISSSPVKPMQRPMATHPDKTRLEWMSNSYNSHTGSANKSNSAMGFLSSYQGLIDDQFRKPHAFAVPHTHHHDSHFCRLTSISPVEQQVANMANMAKQEGFAVPAPLENKATSSSAAAFRCRSVSPAVQQRNLAGNSGNGSLSSVTRLVTSPFNSPLTPDVMNMLSKSKTYLAAGSMAQRSRSVPVNIMMESAALPSHSHQRSSQGFASVLLNKLDRDQLNSMHVFSTLPSTCSAQSIEYNANLSCTDNRPCRMSLGSPDTFTSQRMNCLMEHTMTEPIMFSDDKCQVPSVSEEQPQQRTQSIMLALSSNQQHLELQQQQHLDFSSTQDLLGSGIEHGSELAAGTADFPCEIRMTSELSSSISDLNGLDTNLLFDPNLQHGHYENTASGELGNDELFERMNETSHPGGLDWLEGKDHQTVGLIG